MVDSALLWKRNLYILRVGSFLTACSFSLVMPFLPRFVSELHVSDHLETWAGVIFSITFLSSAVMSPIWGSLADRFGRKPMILRSGLSIGVVYLLMAGVTNHYQLLGLRALNGIFSGFIPSAIALMATNTPEAHVGRALAILQTGMASGQIMGPLFGGVLSDLLGIREAMQVGGALMFTATLLVWVGVKEAAFSPDKKRSNPIEDIKTAMRNPVLMPLMISATLISASLMSLEPILTLFIGTLRQDAAVTWIVRTVLQRDSAINLISGLIFSLPALATIIAAPRWARLGEQWGYPKLLGFGLLMAGLMVLPQSLVMTATQLILLRFAFGVFTSAVQPAVNATIATAVPASFRGRAYGINTSAHFIGAVIGPTIGGLIGSTLGHRAVFVVTSAMLVGASFWVNKMLVTRTAGAPEIAHPQ